MHYIVLYRNKHSEVAAMVGSAVGRKGNGRALLAVVAFFVLVAAALDELWGLI